MTAHVLIVYGCGSVVLPLYIEHDNKTVDQILDIVWDGMNRGSRKEFPVMENLACRSMCVGDFIIVTHSGIKTIHHVASCGFKEVSQEAMDKFLSETKTAISQGKPPFAALNDAVFRREKVDI